MKGREREEGEEGGEEREEEKEEQGREKWGREVGDGGKFYKYKFIIIYYRWCWANKGHIRSQQHQTKLIVCCAPGCTQPFILVSQYSSTMRTTIALGLSPLLKPLGYYV